MRFLLLVAALSNDAELPPVMEVVQKLVDRTQRDRSVFEERGLAYLKTETTYDKEDKVVPEFEESRSWLMWYENGDSLQQLVAENGHRYVDREPESPGQDAFVRLPELYDFAWAPKPLITQSGRPTYVITLHPKEPLPEAETNQEMALVRMHGILYVDVEHLYITELHCELEPFKKFLGAFKAKLATARFTQRMYGDLVVFNRMTVEYRYSTLGADTHKIHTLTYSQYGPKGTQKPPAR